MNPSTLQATFGGLLHDLGKLSSRAGTPSVDLTAALPDTPDWDAVRSCAVKNASSDVARCVWFAHGLSAVADAPVAEPENTRGLPLCSIFTHLNGEHTGFFVPSTHLDGVLREPISAVPEISAAAYQEIVQEITFHLHTLTFAPEQVNALLSLLEYHCSALPASTACEDNRDISLYDHLKLTAALAACVNEYLLESDAHRACFEDSAAFHQENVFLLYTADFSRIQKFIYTVHTAGALRTLRSRSFFLEFLMEHYMDELLDACGLTRTNIIYSGGGHCYLLLPNTAAVRQSIADWNQQFNQWLNEQFGIQLFLANGWVPCSANTLCNIPASESPYKALFRQVNAAAEYHKQHPYTAAVLRSLNRSQAYPDGTRECRVCGNSAQVNADDLCPWCSLFTQLSARIQKQTVYLVSRSARNGSFKLPGFNSEPRFATFLSTDEADTCTDTVRRYTKNQIFTKLSPAVNLYVGDYAANNSIEGLADQARGIRRIAVCRMDVDNLGQAFIAGFERSDQTDPVEKMKYVNLFRAAAFSRQMSLFFKYYINGLLKGLSVSIVYAGGDDVFLVGAWNDTLEAALRIQKQLRSYSCGALTISAGIGLFNDHYPIRAAAEQTAELEDAAKKLPGKCAVALFDPTADCTYSWDTFQEQVLGQKLACLDRFFSVFKNLTAEDEQRSITMLYNLLSLLRATEKDRINFARCAYLLSRLAPSTNDMEKQRIYQEFSHNVIDWARRDVDRQQLITAIYLYVYQNRKGK